MTKFTLIELLIVVVIMVILAALLLPTLFKAKQKARIVICTNSLKQGFMNIIIYAKENDNYLPSGRYEPSGAESSYAILPETFEAIYGSNTTEKGSENSDIYCPENLQFPVPLLSSGTHSAGAYAYQASHPNMNTYYGYQTAIKLSDSSAWPVMSDFNMVGNTWTLSNHNKGGVQLNAFNKSVIGQDALLNFSWGGNSVYIDGATFWTDSNDMDYYKENYNNGSSKTGLYRVRN